MLLLKRTALPASSKIFFFYESGKDGAEVVFLHSCPQSCIKNPVEGLLEVYEDIVEVLLVLEIFLRGLLKICCVMLVPALKPACSSTMIFSDRGFNLFSMTFGMTLPG